MKTTFLMIAVVALVGCGGGKTQSEIVEKAIRTELKKPTGELTQADLEKVEALNFHRPFPISGITDEGLKEVAKCKNLKHLYLWNTEITDAGLKEVAKLQQLTHLSLGLTKVTDVGLKEVAKLQQLKWLSLEGTNVTDVGLKEFAQAAVALHGGAMERHHVPLIRIYLKDAKVTNAGLQEFQRALPNCTIESGWR